MRRITVAFRRIKFGMLKISSSSNTPTSTSPLYRPFCKVWPKLFDKFVNFRARC